MAQRARDRRRYARTHLASIGWEEFLALFPNAAEVDAWLAEEGFRRCGRVARTRMRKGGVGYMPSWRMRDGHARETHTLRVTA